MSAVKIFNYLKANGDSLLFLFVLLVVFYFFLKEFKITRKSSWGMLLGLTALGGIFACKMWKRNKLLEELKQREQALQDLDDRYRKLYSKHMITESAYQKVKSELEQARRDAALGILKADEAHAKTVAEIERKYANVSDAELLKAVKNHARS